MANLTDKKTDKEEVFEPSSIRVFYSYSHEDEGLRRELQKRLKVLKKQGVILEWHDRKIPAGSDWSREISEHLEASQVILLLISPDFLASDYCYDVETKRALELHEQGAARVIPVILRPCAWEDTTFAKLQTLPRNAKPITTWGNQDQAWLDVIRNVSHVCWELRSNMGAAAPAQAPPEIIHTVYARPEARSPEGGGPAAGEALQINLSGHGEDDPASRYRRGFTRLRGGLYNLLRKCQNDLNSLVDSHDKLRYAIVGDGPRMLAQDTERAGTERNQLLAERDEVEAAIKSATGNRRQELKRKWKHLAASYDKADNTLNRLNSYANVPQAQPVKRTPVVERQLQHLAGEISATRARLRRLSPHISQLLLRLNPLEARLLKAAPRKRGAPSNIELGAERARLLAELNRLSHAELGVLFSDLCRNAPGGSAAPRIVHTLIPAIDFQPRPELSILFDWWVDEWQDSVLALIGLGGAGKTALAHEFLTAIRGPQPGRHGEVLPAPDLLFVWSFYDDSNSEGFAHRLLEYLLSYAGRAAQNDPRTDAVTRIEEFLLRHPELRVLLVLDGLERVQDDGTNAAAEDGPVLGELQDQPLRKLLRRLADASGNIRAVVTSRYPLSDLSHWRGGGYRELNLDQLPLDSAIQLLRNRGVQGGDSILKTLVNDFGAHALTLDHLAQILRDFFNGDPRRAADLPPLETLAGDVHGEKQARRLARLFRFYEQKLPGKEFYVLRILSCFRFPVSGATLRQLIARGKGGPKADKIEQLSWSDLMNALHGLNNRKLLYIEHADAQQNYITHPAVREYFYRQLTNLHDIHRNVVIVLSQRVPEKLVTYDEDTLNLLEEVVYHSVKAGDNRNALSIFLDKMGGYEVVGEKFGTYHRGDVILHMFTPPGQTPPGTPFGLTEQQLSDFYYQRSLFAADLGNMRMAESALRAHLRRLPQNWQDENFLRANIRLINYQIMMGVLQGALSMTESFWAEHTRQVKERIETAMQSRPFQAYGRTERQEKINQYMRDRSEELHPLRSCLHVLDELTGGNTAHLNVPPVVPSDPWWSSHGDCWKVVIQFRREPTATARSIIERREAVLGLEPNRAAIRWRILLAHAQVIEGDLEGAEQLLQACLEWGKRTSSQEIIAVSKLNLAKLYVLQRKFPEAEGAFKSGRLVAEECGYRLHLVEFLNVAAEAMLLRGDHEAAVSFSEQSYQLAASKTCNFIWGVANALHVKGKAFLLLRRHEEARQSLTESHKIYHNIRDSNALVVERLLQTL